MRLAAFAAFASLCCAQTFDPKMPTPVPAVSGTVVEAASFRYIDTRIGTGPAAVPGQEYTVHYTGWLRDGTKFDSSIGKEPLKFVQGRRLVIAGWEMGFEGMHVGGTRRLFIPYQLAYGEQGRGKIPPKAELIFDVELLAVKEVAAVSPAADILMPLQELRDKTLRLAEAVPEEKYAWRPAEGVRSFKEVFVHIALGNHLMTAIATGADRDAVNREIAANSAAEKAPAAKAEIVAKLRQSFDDLQKTLEDARPGTLAREIDFFGTKTTARAVFINIDSHIGEHVGQAIAYARMNGIVPPWSK
jgi:peptidylprolyl isomerase